MPARTDKPGVHQELVVYGIAGVMGPLFLLLVGMDAGDGVVPAEFEINSPAPGALSELR